MTDTSPASSIPLAPQPPATGDVPAAVPPGPGVVTQKIWSLRTVAAVAITAVALSGAGGAALAAASDGGTSGPGGGFGGAFGGRPFGGPPGQNGQGFQPPAQQQGAATPSTGGTASLSSYSVRPRGHRPHVRAMPAPLPLATTEELRDA